MSFIAHAWSTRGIALTGVVFLATLITHERLARNRSAGWLMLPYGIAVTVTALGLGSSLTPDALATLGWAAMATVLFALGRVLDQVSLRLVAIGVFLLGFIRLLVVDLASIDPVYRAASFTAVGALAMVVSFIYLRRQRAEQG